MSARDGRRHVSVLTAAAATRADGKVEILSPVVGRLRGTPALRSIVQPGDIVGEIDVLGRRHRIVAPATAFGAVEASEDQRGSEFSQRPVEHGQVLFVLDPEAGGAAAAEAVAAAAAGPGTDGLVFRAPTSGRFYSRPGPDAPAFVEVGGTIETGKPVCLLEIMKTFNRVTYGGDGLPAKARVKAIVPADESDLNAGDPILELEDLS